MQLPLRHVTYNNFITISSHARSFKDNCLHQSITHAGKLLQIITYCSKKQLTIEGWISIEILTGRAK